MKMCVRFLKTRGLLSILYKRLLNRNNQTTCGGELKEVLKISKTRHSEGNILKTMTYLRCTKNGCQAFHSVRKKNNVLQSQHQKKKRAVALGIKTNR